MLVSSNTKHACRNQQQELLRPLPLPVLFAAATVGRCCSYDAGHGRTAGVLLHMSALCLHTCFVYCHPPGMSLSLMPQVLQLATHACTAGTVLHGYALCSHLLCYRHRTGMLLPLLPHVLQLTPNMRAQHYTCMLWGHTCFFHCRPGLSPLPSAGAAACDTRHARTASASIHPWSVHCH